MRSRDMLNTLKNVALVRNAYRAVKSRRQVAELERHVVRLQPLERARYRSVQPAVFENLTIRLDGERERALVRHESMTTYFDVRLQENESAVLTDQLPNSLFESRQRMLASVYAQWTPSERSQFSLLDLGGSVGYYAFLAEPYGFARLRVTDARPEHESQFHLIKRSLPTSSRVCFERADFLDSFPDQSYDVILAQGVLYHVFDHYDFLRRLRDRTRRCLVIDTELSGYRGFRCLAKFENTADSRMGTKGPALYPSYGTVLGLLLACGFRTIQRVMPPADAADYHGYRRNRRVMLACSR